MHYDLAILGAGAAGMMAALAAAESALPIETRNSIIENPPTPLKIALFEKNSRPGIKVLVCGGGRCNFTNAGSRDFLIAQFGKSGRFLTPALHHLDNQALRDFFTARGVPSHVEPGGKIYPDSNQAKSVVDTLLHRIRELNVAIHTGPAGTITAVTRIDADHVPTTEFTENTETPSKATAATSVPSVSSVVHFRLGTATHETHTATALILALGGMSYQRMGTTGDGYRIAQSLGHSLITPRPAIVGLLTEEQWPKDLQGLAVQNIQVIIQSPRNRNSKIETRKSPGDLLFTHFGLSGPAILNPSEIVAALLEKSPTVPLKIDFAPHLTHDHLHALLRNWHQHHGKTLLRKMLSHNTPEILITTTSPDQTAITAPIENRKLRIENSLLPRRLAEKFLALESIPHDQPCSILTSPQIHRLIERLKNCPFTITATRGFAEAMVTAGGIPLHEVNPHTLESKILPNLFITGELLDLTGPSGGYNLQLAFSTGHLAATTAATRLALDHIHLPHDDLNT